MTLYELTRTAKINNNASNSLTQEEFEIVINEVLGFGVANNLLHSDDVRVYNKEAKKRGLSTRDLVRVLFWLDQQQNASYKGDKYARKEKLYDVIAKAFPAPASMLTLYRGVHVHSEGARYLARGGEVKTVHLDFDTSWSLNRAVADTISQALPEGEVWKCRVPKSHVVAYMTSMSSLRLLLRQDYSLEDEVLIRSGSYVVEVLEPRDTSLGFGGNVSFARSLLQFIQQPAGLARARYLPQHYRFFLKEVREALKKNTNTSVRSLVLELVRKHNLDAKPWLRLTQDDWADLEERFIKR